MVGRRDFLGALPAGLLESSSRAGVGLGGNACILIVLVGGPSQIDTWDPKPDAPSNMRSRWRNLRTNVPGIELTELFPRMARQADKYSLVRSVYHDQTAVHETGFQLLQTGASGMAGAQPHVGCATGCHTVMPFLLGYTGDTKYACCQSGLSARALTERELCMEPERVRESYGRNRFGESCLMARRLVERGTKFVTINMFETVFGEPTWDAHGAVPFFPLSVYEDQVAPAFDRAYSALIEDLFNRGLLSSTLVVATGEFGRTPRINPQGGRDHWPGCWTALISGAGVPGGQVYGASDATASEPRDKPVHASRIAATMASKLATSGANAIRGIEPIVF